MKRLFQRGLLLIALTIGLTFHLSAQSTQMTIYLNNGSEYTFIMSDDDHVYFEDNETLVVVLAVYGKGERSERFNLSDIRKITCAETENVTEGNNSTIFLSPNPVHDAFILRNLNSNENIQIFALDGRMVFSLEASENQFIDVSELPIGLYLVKTEHQTLKMIKL